MYSVTTRDQALEISEIIRCKIISFSSTALLSYKTKVYSELIFHTASEVETLLPKYPSVMVYFNVYVIWIYSSDF